MICSCLYIFSELSQKFPLHYRPQQMKILEPYKFERLLVFIGKLVSVSVFADWTLWFSASARSNMLGTEARTRGPGWLLFLVLPLGPLAYPSWSQFPHLYHVGVRC
jgi:hypothetical protein